MTPVQEKLLKAKAHLLLSEPFFATLAIKMEFIEDNTIKTGKTNGSIMKYNSSWVEGLSFEQVKGFIAHTVMHPAMLHHTRRGQRDEKKWNKACDYAINPILIDSGFELPSDELVSDEYRDKIAEHIYNLLPDEPDNGEGDGDNDPGGCGGVEDSDGESQSEVEEDEGEMKETVAQAMNNAIKQGKLPAYMQRMIERVLQPNVDWQEVLARFLSEIVRDDYTFSKPNPRYLHTGFYLPFLQNETVGDIILIVDTSMSINQPLLDKFGTEMQEIVNTFGKGFTVVYVDTEVAGIQIIEADGEVELHPSGGGGTDFRPGFDWIEENDIKPKAVVYFTDGECDLFPEIPDYPVLWALYGHGHYEFDPPFGEVVNVTE